VLLTRKFVVIVAKLFASATGGGGKVG